jgi:hypothetical protein
MVTAEQTAEALERMVAPEAADADAPCTAETAECTCPDFCERDHANE